MNVDAKQQYPGQARHFARLGDKFVKDTAFVGEFASAAAPLAGVKRGGGKTPSDVEMITGATISSRAVIQIINNAIARWQPLMDAYHEEAKP